MIRNLYTNANVRRHIILLLLRERAEIAEEYNTKRVRLELTFNSYEVVSIFPFSPFSKSLYESQLYTRELVDSIKPLPSQKIMQILSKLC